MSRRPRVAFWPAGGMNTASSRLRAYLPCRLLAGAGWPASAFDPAERYEIVVVQKRYDAASYEQVRALRRRGTRVIFDLCDNHYHYRLDHPEEEEDRARRLDDMILGVDLVTVSTPTLGDVVRERTGAEVEVVDDAVDLPPAPLLPWWRWLHRRRSPRQSLRLLWFGAAGMERPPFGLVDLGRIVPELEMVARDLPVSLTVISNSGSLFERHIGSTAALSVDYRPWRRRTFAYEVARHHVTLLPISANPLTLCKTANRPLLSLLLGTAVICEVIPSYEELSPFVLKPPWAGSIQRYHASPELAARHVMEGADFVRKKYTSERVVHQWAAALARVVGSAPAAVDPPSPSTSE